MGRLFVTLDGVAQAPGQPDEDTAGGFTHGGWQAPFAEKASGEAIFEQARTMDALLLGRRTYDIFAAYWPTTPVDSPFKELLDRVPKYVASQTLEEPLTWQNSHLLDPGLEAAVEQVKQRYEAVHVIGSLGLLQSLLRGGLVDRLNLWQYPVLLGTGTRVFGEGTVPAALRLTEAVSYPSGAVQLTYDALGTAPGHGTMGE
ncbi:dihydrofolate reductase family protein [Kineosporia sp. NBRC 101731]|uniref:dihydrofolate reductase family protein n=1 Tax=Kineosporia sp. NBRC 101731 TaxID=3032199 RepID=UPI00249FCD95|nr:dihydrofolate reductase family protein [Kineosporia sp. NBRC 101731]GLY32490.1 deaminase reductase [Kineosporia sp. NBRC 101731]